MLSDIEVLDKPDDQYWMKTAYRIPDVPGANIKPGQTGFKTVPINRMVPRSFVTNLTDGAKVAAGTPVAIRGIAFGGDCGVKAVDFSGDGGATWFPAQLGKDEGPYSFRRFEGSLPALASGTHTVRVRCTNTNGVAQGMDRVWNANGFMQNGIETVLPGRLRRLAMNPIHPAALIAALALSPLVALAAPAPEPMRFTSQSIQMPTSDRIFPDGPGAEAVNNNCLACHSAGMVLTQPKLTKAQWTETVNKMVHVYKAPVDQADVQTIVDYLTALKPTP